MLTGWPNLSNPTDSVFFLIMGISLTLLLLTSGTMVYFVFRYSRKRNPRPESIRDNVPLEIVWTVIPTILVLVIFWAGWKGFVFKRTVPPDAMLVKVTARQWSWNFTYENGKESGTLNLPLGKPVKLSITSADVLHSLFIPAYRVKEDAVPGRETYLWFQPDRVGTYDLFCTEYCGVGHSAMISKVVVMPEAEFQAWYWKGPAPPSAVRKRATMYAEGERLIREKGCTGCHSLDGTKKVGPTFKGMFGKKETVITDGKEREVVVDEAYTRKSLLEPQADIVKGYPPVMPAQKGLLTEQEIDTVVQYLKTVK